MWPFTRKPKPLPGKKLAIIAVRDYPKEAYSAYWEIGISPDAPFFWFVKLYDYASGALLDSANGRANTEEDARRASQTWVLERIENYRRRAV